MNGVTLLNFVKGNPQFIYIKNEKYIFASTAKIELFYSFNHYKCIKFGKLENISYASLYAPSPASHVPLDL